MEDLPWRQDDFPPELVDESNFGSFGIDGQNESELKFSLIGKFYDSRINKSVRRSHVTQPLSRGRLE